MEVKLFELRDRMTFIPVLAVRMSEPCNVAENYLLIRAGYRFHGEPGESTMVLLTRAQGRNDKANSDPMDWGDRTFSTAHEYITRNFTELQSGDVIDVEFILKESAEPKISERLSAPWS